MVIDRSRFVFRAATDEFRIRDIPSSVETEDRDGLGEPHRVDRIEVHNVLVDVDALQCFVQVVPVLDGVHLPGRVGVKM